MARSMAQILMQMTRDAERERKSQLRKHDSDPRAQTQLHAAFQADRTVSVVEMNAQLKEEVVGLETILADSLATDNYLDIESFKVQPEIPPFEPGQLAVADSSPTVSEFRPKSPGFFQSLLPGTNARHKRAVAIARREYESAVQACKQARAEKKRKSYPRLRQRIR